MSQPYDLLVLQNVLLTMSLPGVDPTANIGAPGNATGAGFTEPVIEHKESKGEQIKEISHTGISLGLEVISKQYIYTGTYSWSTTDTPGKVLHAFPIHPEACNKYTDHVYQMFNTWTGGQKARIRIIGTAFYGGGLFFVRIPPNYTIDQVNAMDLSSYTAFPHADMDPKNISSIDIDIPDYRVGHFHHGPLELSDSTSFAGWLAIVVNARLVTQSPEIHSIDLRVEMAGDYTFRVPGPIRTGPTETGGPILDGHLNKIPDEIGTDDVVSTLGGTVVTVQSTDRNRITNGNVFTINSEGKFLYTPGENATLAVKKHDYWDPTVRAARSDWYDDSKGVQTHLLLAQVDPPGPTQSKYSSSAEIGLWAPVNIRWGSKNGTWVFNPQAEQAGGSHVAQVTFQNDAHPMVVTLSTAPGYPTPMTTYMWGGGGLSEAFELTDMGDFLVPADIDPAIGKESFVTFATNGETTMNAQLRSWAEDIASFKGSWPTGAAAMYQGYDKSGVLVGNFKLRSTGLLYTSPSKNTTRLPVVSFKFDQWVPEETPIPVVMAQQAMYLHSNVNSLVKKEMRLMRASMRT
jgi:hypothetical protein